VTGPGAGAGGQNGRALRFVVLLGVVSLFADVTYEGARSITGPFLGSLGAGAAVVGFASGLGELVGYALRLVSGYLSERTGRYWALTIVGYCVNLLAVPLLALTGRWETAVALIVAERFGKALRNPPRDAMLSHAASRLGRGWAFGLHEALDQAGAVTGPVFVSAILIMGGSLRSAFAVLLIPAVLALSVLAAARLQYPLPGRMEEPGPKSGPEALPRAFWIYLAGAGLVGAGYADFPLIAYHFGTASVVREDWIPLFYAAAMAVDAVSALFFGRLYDRAGVRALLAAVGASAFFAPLVFLGGPIPAFAGMLLWGVGMGAQESVMRAAVAEMTASSKRGTAFGLFNSGFGLFWFAGSALMGLLYGRSVAGVVLLSVASQVLALPLIAAAGRRAAPGRPGGR